MKRLLGLTLVVASSVASFAQSRSAFVDVSAFQDLHVEVSNSGLTYKVILGANPKLLYQNAWYNITDVFGFWTLSNDVDFNVVNQPTNQWNPSNNNAGPGAIAGWKTNPNTGITPNNSYTFTFDSLNTDAVDQVGFHVRLDQYANFWQGNTGYATVPEPTSMIALALGAIGLAARRRRK